MRNGLIEDIRAENGQTNDDLLALNADDSIVRLENRDILRGPIENLTFRNIHAENCYTAIRLLNVKFMKIHASGEGGDILANLSDKRDSCRIDIPFSNLELNSEFLIRSPLLANLGGK